MEPTLTDFAKICRTYGITFRAAQLQGESWILSAFIGSKYIHSQHQNLKMAMALLIVASKAAPVTSNSYQQQELPL